MKPLSAAIAELDAANEKLIRAEAYIDIAYEVTSSELWHLRERIKEARANTLTALRTCDDTQAAHDRRTQEVADDTEE